MLTRTSKVSMGVVAGVALAVGGLYGWLGQFSLLLTAAGLLMVIASAGVLLFAQDLRRLRSPHPCLWIPFGLAVGLHLYEQAVEATGPFALGWFAWALTPQVLALLLSCFVAARLPAVVGTSAALLVDIWTFYVVFVAPASSTASLAMIWMPLWSVLIVVPGVTVLAWLLLGKREPAVPSPFSRHH